MSVIYTLVILYLRGRAYIILTLPAVLIPAVRVINSIQFNVTAFIVQYWRCSCSSRIR
jgi:hypothetical protein